MSKRPTYIRPLDFKRGCVDMNHGGGGRASAQLIKELFIAEFGNEWLLVGDDAAAIDLPEGQRTVVATDAHVISPLFFPGGDIGSLAVHGTINDVAMLGATPLYLSVSFILEEGFPLDKLKAIVGSMASASRSANVPIVSGDTKVVERGKGDGVYISSTGIGCLPINRHISGSMAKVGDTVLVSGTMGDHGVAVMASRESLEFATTIESDSAAIHDVVSAVLGVVPEGAVHTLRDPTRGGLATALNEIAQQSSVGMRVNESKIPINSQVNAACELLGLDPLYIANEGKCVLVCAPDCADLALHAMQSHALGKNAAIIGSIVDDPNQFVQMETNFGGHRIIDWMSGEPLPRIC